VLPVWYWSANWPCGEEGRGGGAAVVASLPACIDKLGSLERVKGDYSHVTPHRHTPVTKLIHSETYVVVCLAAPVASRPASGPWVQNDVVGAVLVVA
jgi:hypothetical protein